MLAFQFGYLIIKSQDISEKGPVRHRRGLAAAQKEIEVEIWSPEVECLWKLMNERIYILLLLSYTPGSQNRIDYQRRKVDYI